MKYIYTLGIILALGNVTLCATEEMRNGVKRTISPTHITYESGEDSVTWHRTTNAYAASMFADEGLSPRNFYVILHTRFHDDRQPDGNS